MLGRMNGLSNQCRVCGAPAQYSYFGAITCHACKMFFRRNAQYKQFSFKCNFNNQCEISFLNRQVCSSCRLKKCFQSGMSTFKFRAVRSKKSTALVSLPTLNLLQQDSSLLSTDQWTLLSNLCHIFDESKLISIGHRLTNASQSNYSMMMQQFLDCIFQTTGDYLCLNRDLCQLSSNERSIMLRNAAHHVSCQTCGFIMYQTHLLATEMFPNTLQMMYGRRVVETHRWAMKFILPDIVLIKLALALFSLCENTYHYSPNSIEELTNSRNIFQIQSKYAEVTWKYLLYKYGFHHAVKQYLQLMSWLMAMTSFLFHAQSLMNHVNDVDSLVEQIELTLILDDIM